MSKAEKTKQFIIEKTATLFNTKGYAGTSLNDMAEATGLSKGSIYGNFANKDEVALAVFDYNLKKVNTILSSEISKVSGAREKILIYTSVYQNFLSYPFPEGGCPVLNTGVEADDTHPALKQKAAQAITHWKTMLTKLIAAGIEQKEFSRKTDAEAVALAIIALIEGATLVGRVTGKTSYRNSIMQTLKNMIEALK